MSIFEVLLLAVGMAIDAFAVCVVAGALPGLRGQRPAFRLAFHFGLFQFIMPVVGWLAGASIEPLLGDIDHWLAFGLLAFIGIRMIHAARSPEQPLITDPSRGWNLVMLSTAVSIDALAVGLSLGLLGIPAMYPALLIGMVTSLLSMIGLRLGAIAGRRLGKPAHVVGGSVLIVIGLRIVFQHVML